MFVAVSSPELFGLEEELDGEESGGYSYIVSPETVSTDFSQVGGPELAKTFR